MSGRLPQIGTAAKNLGRREMTSNLPERGKLPQITEELCEEGNNSKQGEKVVRDRTHFYGPAERLEDKKKTTSNSSATLLRKGDNAPKVNRRLRR